MWLDGPGRAVGHHGRVPGIYDEPELYEAACAYRDVPGEVSALLRWSGKHGDPGTAAPRSVLELAAGTRIVNNAYRIEGWQEVEIAYADGYCVVWCTAYLYLVPAKLAGAWRLPTGEVRFTQEFQALSGTLVFPGGRYVSVDGEVKGDHVRFTAGLDVYTGRVRGNEMTGEAKGGYSGYWKATRLR